MKIKDILKGAAAVAGTLHPGVGAAIGLVNQFLPADQKLPGDATGQQVLDATDRLTPEQRSQVLELEMTELKESHASLRAMLTADATMPHTTRPKIALNAFRLLAVVTVAVVAGWLWAALQGDADTVKVIMDGWPFLLSLLAPFAALLRSYFGILRQEHQNKLNAASGVPTRTVADALTSIFDRGK